MSTVVAADQDPSASSSADGITASRRAPELMVMAALVVVSVLNYAYTAVLVYLLPARQFALVGAGSSLLLVCGTVAAASVPWVLAREIATARQDPTRRQEAVGFCVVGTLVEAVASGLVTGVIAASYGNSAAVAALVGSVVAIFTSATACGYLQGFERFGMIAALKVAEVALKLISGVLLVELGFGAAGAIVGFGIGSVVVTLIGGAMMRPDLRVARSSFTNRRLWSAAGGIMAIQGGVALLASLDVIIGSLVISDRARLATYEVAQILTRGPVFIATAMSIIVFPRLVTRDRPAQATAICENLGLWLRVCVPIAIVTATFPRDIIDAILPTGYGDVSAILDWTSLAGLVVGAVNLVSTYFQATGNYRDPCCVLGLAIVVLAGEAVVGNSVAGIEGLAIAVSAVGSGVIAAFLVVTRSRWPGATRRLARSALVPAFVTAPLFVLRDRTGLWVIWALVAGVGPALVTVARFRRAGGKRPRILHLGFEDPRRPGAGGGSVRTHEINRCLADRFDITVVCARYRGSRTRLDDGVRYVHVGLPIGYFPSLLSYFVGLPWALMRHDSDLVVEDFAAPFSSVAVPWLTRRPVVGVVQWLFAREKALQYRVPFHLMEELGVRSHTDLVAVSADLGADLAARNRRARVSVVSNGLCDDAFVPRHLPRRDVVYLGRLEIAQKGLDLLLRAWVDVAAQPAGNMLLLAGDGPDEGALRAMVDALGLTDRVRFTGRVQHEDRFDVLASASVVVMPSRYESFGMVAAEALAVATPVVAFAIPCLGSLVDATTGRVVAPFDCTALADAISELLTHPDRARALGDAGPGRVAALRWDRLARLQGDVYEGLIAKHIDFG